MSQKALLLSKLGEDLSLGTRPIPTPAAGEVLVKVLIASLNPHDAKSKSIGLFVNESLPTPLGTECIAKVEKLGPDVTKFAVGDVIMTFGFPFNPNEQYTQEYGIASVANSAKLPKNVSLDEALTFPLNAQTSFFALFHSTGFGLPPSFVPNSNYPPFDYANSTIVIIGGGAATGKFAIEFCRLAGFGNIITIASKSSEKELKSLGATHVIDRKLSDDQLEDAVRAITGDELVMALDVYNFGDRQTIGARFLSTTKKGILVSIIRSGSVDESQFREPKKAGYERKPVFCNPKGYPDVAIPFWENIVSWVESGDLKPTTFSVIDGLDAKAVNDALDKYNGDRNVVKPHLHIASS
jgi:NADPH:quinone reductase